MSVTVATLSRSGNDRAVLRGAAEWLKVLFAAGANRAAAETSTAHTAEELSFWQLYRLTVGYDSINPKVAAELRKRLVG